MQLRRYSKSKKTDDLVIASTETGNKRISQEQSNWQWITPDLEPEIAFSLVSLSPSTICQCQDQDFENSRALFTNEINNEVEGIGPKMRSKMRQRDWSSQSNQDQDIYPIFIYIFIYIFNFNFLYIFHIIYSHLSITKWRVCYGPRKENGSPTGTKEELLFSIKRIVFFQRLWTSLDLSNQ